MFVINVFYVVGELLERMEIICEWKKSAESNYSIEKQKCKKESPKRDSNTRPAAYEADALPTELLRHEISLARLYL